MARRARSTTASAKEAAGSVRAAAERATSGLELDRRMRENPYPLLSLAFLVCYVAAGGLFSRMSRPLARAAAALLIMPRVRERAAEFAYSLRDKLVTSTARA